MAITVVLNDQEQAYPKFVGNQRTDQALARGYRDKHGAEVFGAQRGRDISVLGALGEAAAAKALGLPYTPGQFHDLGADGVGDFEIRTTEKHSNSLIIREADPERIFILVTTEDRRTYIVQGWMPSKAARLNASWRRAPGGRPPAWFVPGACLIDIRWLPLKPVADYAA